MLLRVRNGESVAMTVRDDEMSGCSASRLLHGRGGTVGGRQATGL
jgi:hypothetical protein